MVTVVTSPADPGDFGSILGSGRAPGERNGNPLQYACLGNPTDQRSLEGYSPWGHKRVRCDSVTNNKAQIKERGGGGGGWGGDWTVSMQLRKGLSKAQLGSKGPIGSCKSCFTPR